MKAILMSDRPKWCALMMNGDKTIEVRKGTALYKAIQKLIDEYGYADIYVYCTKDSKLSWFKGCMPIPKTSNNKLRIERLKSVELNGKVIFKFRCYSVEEITLERINDYSSDTYEYQTDSLIESEILEKSCLKGYELNDYLSQKLLGCAIHISYLEIFDKPKELSEFFKSDGKPNYALFGSSHYELANRRITKAPQNYCYIEIGE